MARPGARCPSVLVICVSRTTGSGRMQELRAVLGGDDAGPTPHARSRASGGLDCFRGQNDGASLRRRVRIRYADTGRGRETGTTGEEDVRYLTRKPFRLSAAMVLVIRLASFPGRPSALWRESTAQAPCGRRKGRVECTMPVVFLKWYIYPPMQSRVRQPQLN